jgi:membrane protease YdiL (CAAX protease family)
LVRGYLYSGLRKSWKFLPALLVTSLLFGLAHLQLGSGAAVLWAAGVDTFTLSLVLVYLRETTGALYAGMLVHSLNNLIAFGVHFH